MNNKPAPLERINQLLKQYEMPSLIIQRFRDYMHADMDGARELLRQLTDLVDVSGSSNETITQATTDHAFHRVRSLLMRTGNRGLSREDIEAQSGLSEHQVHTLLYRSHRDMFSTEAHPDGGRKRIYRLTIRAVEPLAREGKA